jgi:hypothetical protein
MAPRLRSRLGALAASLKFALCYLGAVLRNRPLPLSPATPGARSGSLWPDGRFMPAVIGADDGDGGAGDDGDEGDGSGEGDGGGDGGDEGADANGDDGDGDDGDTRVAKDDDWKTKSRKNETRAKRAERERNEEREKREKLEEKDKSESEKAISAAERKGREEAAAEAAAERKADRLEVAVTRLASKTIKVGDGEDSKEHRFADIEDALIHIERGIAKGEIDEDDIFDDEGKVKADALQGELAHLLARKPHLRDGGSEESPRPKGDPETRKGDPTKTDLESLTPEDHAKRQYGDGK